MVLFFFKQKPAYERRISDWSSDVCSSDLHLIARGLPRLARNAEHRTLARAGIADDIADPARRGDMVERAALLGGQVETASGRPREIGRASCRERVCQYV